jgi:serine/threonine-protein kinase SRPK3
MSDSQLFDLLGEPEKAPVRRLDEKSIDSGMPQYLVRPAEHRRDFPFLEQPIKIVDFGEAFTQDDAPCSLHTPLAVRAPEAVFSDKIDYRVDLWSAGCLSQVY